MIFAQAIPPLFARLVVRRNFSFFGIVVFLFLSLTVDANTCILNFRNRFEIFIII